ncbi:MAG: 50S ribosomal protein L25 [Opitutales bacterium]
MQQYKLNIVNRREIGSGPSRRLRASGKIPASLYGKEEARPITVAAVDFRDLNRNMGDGAGLVQLTDEQGVEALTLIQEIQRDPLKDTVNHIDFKEIARGEAFVTKVPVHLEGEEEALGVKNEGGMIDHRSHEVDIRCRPSRLPDAINVDVSGLSVGDALYVRDLPEIEGVEYLNELDQVVVSCQPPTVAIEDETPSGEEVAADEVPASKVQEETGEEEGEKEPES